MIEAADFCGPHRDRGGFCPLAELMGCHLTLSRKNCPKSAEEARRARTAVNLIAYYDFLRWNWLRERMRLIIMMVAASDDLAFPVRSWLIGYWRSRGI